MEFFKQKKEWIILFIYLAGFLCMTVTLTLFQPLANTTPPYVNPPDEHARFLVPWYICQTGKIPTGFEEEVKIPGYGFSYKAHGIRIDIAVYKDHFRPVHDHKTKQPLKTFISKQSLRESVNNQRHQQSTRNIYQTSNI